MSKLKQVGAVMGIGAVLYGVMKFIAEVIIRREFKK